MMILTLAVLGMALGSFGVVQPVKANIPVDDCDHFTDEQGCSYADCGECLAWQCPGGSTIIDCGI
ncbi:MAG: hypothetical protein ABJ333_06700 [Algoriphagus sp.]|uniref:hypothetical protein n=1 Tax=Algoriphagus sp. TaxID=1872435 RepID=UPI003297DA5F